MSLPRKSSRNGTRGYAHLVEIDVPVARVWRALTEPGLIKIWSGQEAEIDARQGGMYRIGKRSGSAWTCFHALFLNSICAIRLAARIAPIGRKKIAIDSHELRHS